MSAITADTARAFADAWLADWNSHDLNRILEHYSEDVTFCSPFIKAAGLSENGVLSGRSVLRSYFSLALQRFPDLRFHHRATLHGPESITLLYGSVRSLLAAETMILNEAGKVTRVWAQYSETRLAAEDGGD